MSNYSDTEKGIADSEIKAGGQERTAVFAADDGVKRTGGFIGKLWAAVKWADSFGVEVRGIERVPEDERTHTKISDAGSLWLSANLTISTFALGALGKSIWYLGLVDASLTIVFFNLLCCLPVALFSTWGMQTGLRQMVIGRYSFGSIGIYFPVLLNCVACIGWSVINTIAGASALNAIGSEHHLPIAAGVVIIAMLTLVVALFGYKWVHLFERYASYPVFVIMLIMLGGAAASVTNSGIGGSGRAEAGGVLSFGGTIAGFALGWTSLAADYTVNFPATTSRWRVFLYTYAGLILPLVFVEVLGAVCIQAYPDVYAEKGVGHLLAQPLLGLQGFGSFLLVLLALSIVANNIPNMYSFALTFQAFGKYAQAIPRMFLVLIGTGIYIVLAIVGASKFESFLDNMLVILAYWLAIYTVILMEEHYIFRRGSFSHYDLDRYNDRTYLPIGIAALITVGIGAAGAVLGMAQVLYVGVIGHAVTGTQYGGDIGFELSGSFAAISYPILRYLEIKFIGR